MDTVSVTPRSHPDGATTSPLSHRSPHPQAFGLRKLNPFSGYFTHAARHCLPRWTPARSAHTTALYLTLNRTEFSGGSIS